MASRAPTGLEPDLSVHGPPTARKPRAAGARGWTGWALAATVVVAAMLQLWLSLRPGLWVDEIFSLAVATGHSVEHPTADARPALGDFVDHPRPGPPAALAAYATHDAPPAPPWRVVRAVFMSDTSPPLYYLLLSAWTRLAGTSDAALRLFSTFCALLCLPLLFAVGREIGGRTTGLVACALFAVAPPVLYFASEGRMYALTWLWTLILAWLALRLAREGSRPPVLLAWAVVGAAGLLTHYFFGFVWAAVSAWLLLHPGRLRRAHLAAAAALTGLLVLPWFVRVPESLGRWRVTGGWLNDDLTLTQMVKGPPRLIKYMVWWGAEYRDKGELLAALIFALLLAAMLRRGARRWVTEKPQLLWLWVLGAALGPVAFDLALGTTSSQIGRYGLAGLPAALLLVALGTGALPAAARAAFLALFILSAWPTYRDIYGQSARPFHPFPELATQLSAWHGTRPSDSSDVVIVHGVPTGSIGVARYLGDGPPIASWSVRLHQRRTREDLAALLAGRCRVALVKVHDLNEPSPAERWLRAEATLTAEEQVGRILVYYFVLRPPSPCTDAAPGGPGAAARRTTSQPPTRSTGT